SLRKPPETGDGVRTAATGLKEHTAVFPRHFDGASNGLRRPARSALVMQVACHQPGPRMPETARRITHEEIPAERRRDIEETRAPRVGGDATRCAVAPESRAGEPRV